MMALAIAMMLISGIIMVNVELEKSWQFKLYQWHKSGGVLLMLALTVRILLRAITSIPPLPPHFPKLEQIAAKLGHLGLYLAMATMVLSGWTMVSSSAYGLPTVVFGWFEWPHIPALQSNQTVETLARNIHFFSAIGLGLLVIGHIGAVIKHRLVDQENLLQRMWWQRKPMPVRAPCWKVSLIGVSTAVFTVVVIAFIIFSPLQSPVSNTASAITSDTVTTGQKTHDFVVDTARSRVSFSGVHMDNPFTGFFDQWQAQFYFNPDGLEQSHIYARFVTGSADTGNALYDGTLAESDWFDSDTYPEATFTSETISANLDTDQQNSYRVMGVLTIRAISQPVSFNMKVEQLDDTSIHLNAAVIIDRLAYKIGAESDPDADWVSRNIAVDLNIQADRK